MAIISRREKNSGNSKIPPLLKKNKIEETPLEKEMREAEEEQALLNKWIKEVNADEDDNKEYNDENDD